MSILSKARRKGDTKVEKYMLTFLGRKKLRKTKGTVSASEFTSSTYQRLMSHETTKKRKINKLKIQVMS